MDVAALVVELVFVALVGFFGFGFAALVAALAFAALDFAALVVVLAFPALEVFTVLGGFAALVVVLAFAAFARVVGFKAFGGEAAAAVVAVHI